MDQLLKELRADRRAAAASKARKERIRKLFIQVRLDDPKLEVVDLEAMTGVDRAIISRMTAEAVGTSRKAKAPVQD